MMATRMLTVRNTGRMRLRDRENLVCSSAINKALPIEILYYTAFLSFKGCRHAAISFCI
jgi:hypothetical protein